MTTPTSDTDPEQAEARRAAGADLLAGGTFVALGLGFAIGAAGYDLGSLLQMGPGYLPLVLGVVLTGLGLVIAGQGVLTRMRGTVPASDVEAPTQAPGPVPWVRGALLVGAFVVFGLTVDGLGLAGALFLATFMAALAGHRNTVLKAALIAAGLTVLCLVVFVSLLQLRLPVLGEWLGG